MKDFRAVTGVENAVMHYRDINVPLAKIVFGDKNPENKAKLERLLSSHPLAEKFELISSEKTLFEILPRGVNKGSVLPKLCDNLGIDLRKTIAIGDYDNDIPMISAAGLGVAVANACDGAKAVADLITVSNEEHAIAKIIYDLESGKICL